ncbi:MAG: hypothetical protein H0W08_26150 [Acidobacteria bacterium]|nr:hypothetical protein [Acidobacteriota bacterium]
MRTGFPTRQRRRNVAASGEGDEVRIRERAVRTGSARIQGDEAIGIRRNDAAEQQRIDDREHGRVGADAERQRHDGGNGKGGRPPESAERIANVLRHLFEQRAGANRAHCFFHLLDATELDQRRAPRARGIHSARDVFVGQQIGVAAQLGVEVDVQASAVQQVADDTSQPGERSPH